MRCEFPEDADEDDLEREDDGDEDEFPVLLRVTTLSRSLKNRVDKLFQHDILKSSCNLVHVKDATGRYLSMP